MDKNEFCKVITGCKKQLYATAFSILKNETDAEDAVCSAIQKGYAKLDSLRSPKKFQAWMAAIVRNEALQILRKKEQLPGNEMVESLLEPVCDSHNELFDIVMGLPEEYRIVIVLYYYNGLSIKEIAETLELATGTVKSRMNRGRNMLKEILGEDGRCENDGF